MSVIAEPVRHEFDDYVRYSETHPDGAFKLIDLVMEVSSTSRPKDRKKAQLYARLGIPEYWLVDLVDDTVSVHRDAIETGEAFAYPSSRDFGKGESITSSAVEGLSVDTNFLLELAA